jgi:sugar fermentation stimulation protein A
MLLNNPQKGIFLKRYNRFLVDIMTDRGQPITSHCPNTGAMLGVLEKDAAVVYTPSLTGKGKLGFTWEMVFVGGTWIGINTFNPNKLFYEAFTQGMIPELSGYNEIRREVQTAIGCRIDFLLKGPGGICYVEVKNMHLCRSAGVCEFPDSVTERGRKHLESLGNLKQETGARCVVFFVGQRSDISSFKVAEDIDPKFAKACLLAKEKGVEFMGYNCLVEPSQINISTPLENLICFD